MNLAEWAHACRWYREGTLPVSAQQVGRLILVSVGRAGALPRGGADVCARVSSRGQKADLDREVARLSADHGQAGLPVVRVEAGVGSGMSGTRARAWQLLAGSEASVVVVEHRLYGRRPARNRALTSVGCARRDIGPGAAR